MTDNAPVPVTATDPQAAVGRDILNEALRIAGLLPDPTGTDARYMPGSPRGIGSQITAKSVAEFGAILNAAGAERGAATKFISRWQELALQFVIVALPDVIADLNDIQKARIMRAMQDVQALQKVTLSAPSTWRERMNGVIPSTSEYVAVGDVLRVLANALDRPLNV